MKFGNYFEAQLDLLPVEYGVASIPYTKLKLFVKHRIAEYGLGLATGSGERIDATVASRLSSLHMAVPEWIRQLVSSVDVASRFITSQQRKVLVNKSGESHSQRFDHCAFIDRFIILNRTAVSKLLKKLDRHAGIVMSGVMMASFHVLPLFDAPPLEYSQLREKLLAELTGGEAHGTKALGMAKSADNIVPINFDNPKKLAPITSLKTDISASSLVLVSLSGPHGTDISNALLQACAAHNVPVHDVSFNRLRHQVTFSALIPSTSLSSTFLEAVKESATRWEAVIEIKEESEQAAAMPVATNSTMQGSAIMDRIPSPVPTAMPEAHPRIGLEDAPYIDRIKYSATILDTRPGGLTAAFLAAWNQLLLEQGVSIVKMRRLNDVSSTPHGLIPNDVAFNHRSDTPGMICLDYLLSVPARVDIASLRHDMFALSRAHATDVALQPANVYRRHKRLVVFDMDSTLIQQEVIDELAREIGVMGEVSRITERAMNGEMDFKESLRQRVGLLKDAPMEVITRVRARLTYTDGVKGLCRALKRAGLKLAVISGGFMPMAQRVKDELGLDYAFANQLGVSSDGKCLAGVTMGPVVDAVRKAELLEVIAQAEGVSLEQVIAVGDGANDLLMLGKAGLGVAFNAKPRVQERAATRINQKSLGYVLYLLGYTDAEIVELLSTGY